MCNNAQPYQIIWRYATMSKPNPNPTPQPKDPDVTFPPPEPLVYNIAGIRPVKVIYQLDKNQLEREIQKIAEREISGVQDVTIDVEDKTGLVRGYIWFEADSSHFVQTLGSDTIFEDSGQKIGVMSPEFKRFASKYGWTKFDDDPERYRPSEVSIKSIMGENIDSSIRKKIVFMQLAFNKFMEAIFDPSGVAYRAQYKRGTPRMHLNRIWKWRKNTDSGGKYIEDNYNPDFKNSTLIGIIVEKYVVDAFELTGRPRARRSGRFN